MHIKFLVNYWQGKLPLQLSLWLIFIGLLILVSIVEPLLLNMLFPKPEQQMTATLISLFISRLVIFPWQLVGLFRATEKDYLSHGHAIKTRSIQALMFLSVVFTMIYSIELIQTANFNKQQIQNKIQEIEQINYTLEIQNNGQRLVIKGDIEIGITQAVESLIKKNPKLSSVLLESLGGQIYEGRGLSLLFSKKMLDTIVLLECSSACATAFIGGNVRYLGAKAKIGFHQYKQDMGKFPKAVPYHDLKAEQQRDLTLFKSRNISEEFLEKVFDKSANSIWFPNTEELLKAGVVHKMVISLP